MRARELRQSQRSLDTLVKEKKRAVSTSQEIMLALTKAKEGSTTEYSDIPDAQVEVAQLRVECEAGERELQDAYDEVSERLEYVSCVLGVSTS